MEVKKASVEVTEATITYDVVLTESEYGYAVSCPALLGCHSQGEDEADALANIQEAITGWLKSEARAVESRIKKMMDEYNEAGYPTKRATVTVTKIKADAPVH